MKRLITISSLVILLLLGFVACQQLSQDDDAPLVIQPTSVAAEPSPTLRPTQPPTAAPTITAAPLELDAWLDETIDLENMRADQPLIIHFNQPMDAESTNFPLVLEPAVKGALTWDDDYTTLTFTPSEPYQPATTYAFVMPRVLESTTGQRFSPPLAWQFATDHGARILSRRPSGTAIGHLDEEFVINFNRPMDQDAFAAALTIEPPLTYSLAWDGNAVTITPAEELRPEQSYTFTIAKTAVSTSGYPLASDYTWTSTVNSLIQSASGPTKTNREQPIQIRFRHNIAGESALEQFSIEPALEGDLSWDETRTMLIFAPTEPLATNTIYTVRFDDGLLSTTGQSFASPQPVTFGPYSPILFTRPNGQNTSPLTEIEIVFDRPMDETSAAAAFSISPAIEGTLTWDETTLIFQPTEGAFEPQTTYDVVIETSIQTAAGQPILDEPYSWQFRTAALQEVVNFGWGPNAQVLDTNGRRAIQYTMFKNQANVPIRFDLYELNVTQFLDRYSSNFRGVMGYEEKIIPTADLPLAYTWETETEIPQQEHNNVQEMTIPAEVPAGLYILDMRAGFLNDQLILVITNNTIMVKQAEGQLVSWVTEIQGGHKEGIDVGIYSRDGEQIAAGVTNENGIFEVDLNHRDPAPLIVVAQDGDDITVSGLSWEWRSAGSYGGWWQNAATSSSYAAHIYTDRPIYKPGQLVYYKAIIRTDDDAVLDIVPEGTEVTVRVRDARNNVVRTESYTTNNFGTIIGQFQLAEGAMLGDYSVEVSLPATAERKAYVKTQLFKVEDYRKPDYSVTVTVDETDLVTNETVEVTVEATYYYGEPVADAAIDVKLFNLIDIYYWDTERDEFVWYEGRDPKISLRTDANGRATFTVSTEQDYSANSVDWRSSLTRSIMAIEASVNDGSQQVVSGFARVNVYNAGAMVKADTNGYFHKPGEPFFITAEVADIFGQPLNGRNVSARFLRYGDGDYDDLIQSAQLTTDASGQATTSVTIDEPGYYQVKVVSQDPDGRSISYTTWLYIFDRDFSYWFGSQNSGGLTIRPEQESYAPGENARLIVESTMSGPAILTFERGTTRREQLVQLTAPVTILEAPLVASDAPNIFVSINVYEPETEGVGPNTWNSLPDAYLRTATTEIKVPVTDKTLVVTITPNQDEYAPREQATFTVRVTNQQGDPVSAEVSLAMVDEALYALSEDLSEPMFESFYYDRNNIVTTYNSLRPSRELWGGGMGGGGGDGGYEGSPRSDFPDTAAWFPRLLTDANGEAQVTLTIPDNLTTWRLTGKATTADTQVGESITNFIVSKEIILRPLLPRTLTAGDEILLSAMVQNYSDLTLTFDVTITAVDDISGEEALLFNDETTQKVTLEPGESRIVGWSASAPQASNARITVAAVFQNQLLDGVELPLVIKPLAVPDVTTFIGQFQGTKTLEIAMPAEALPMSTVKIELSRSIAGTLFEGLEYLTGFPYGCVEQTMSKALPNAVVGRAFNQLGLANPTLDADLPAKIDAGIQKLYGYQHNDGGWGWWFDDASDHYQTAWVIFGLVNTAEAGYEIDAQVIQRGANWLQNELPSMNPKTRAYALYSMALAVDFLDQPSAAADPEALSADFVLSRVRDLVDDQYDNLDPFSQASLTLAFWELGAAAEARELLEQFEETAVRDSVNGQVYWGLGGADGYYHQKTMASRTRTTAHMLSAFSRIQPNHELVGGMVRYLMAQRSQNGWGTTNETSFAIIGLTDHLLATSFNDGATETTYRVVLNGEEITSGNLGRGEPAVALELPAELFRSGSNQLRIEQGGTGQLYYGVKQTVFVAQEEITAAGAIKIERQYFDAQNRPLDLESVAPGDLVRVQLKVTVPGDLSYVIVEDKIPGGLEALNERLNTTTHTGVGYEPHYYWQSYGYNHKEVFGDRVSFFITELSRGTHTYEYMTRVTHAGMYVAMPAEAYAMYDLTSWGRSASQVITIDAE